MCDMLPVEDYARVRDAITTGTTVALKTASYASRHREHVDRVLSLYLYELGLVHLHNNLAYCVHELAGNSRNALLKRLWFRERGLDITDRRVYSKYMSRFRGETAANPSRYLRRLEESEYRIRFLFAHDRERIRIIVEHNAPLLPIERERIAAKLEAARRYTSMADAYGDLSDFSEGAGLGIAMVVVILKTLGLTKDVLTIGDGTDGTTQSAITLQRTPPRRTVSYDGEQEGHKT